MKKLVWLSNCHKEANNSTFQGKIVFGKPKATEDCTVEKLVKCGMIGVYRVEEDVMKMDESTFAESGDGCSAYAVFDLTKKEQVYGLSLFDIQTAKHALLEMADPSGIQDAIDWDCRIHPQRENNRIGIMINLDPLSSHPAIGLVEK